MQSDIRPAHQNNPEGQPKDSATSSSALYIASGVAVLSTITAGWLAWQYTEQTATLTQLQTSAGQYESRLAQASSTIADLHAEQEELRDNLEDIIDDYEDELTRNEEFEDDIRDLSRTIGDLSKLAETDKELLQKYSKVYFLNENYIPERVKEIPSRYILAGKGDQYFHANALPFLEDLIDDAEDDGIDLKVVSAYRSFDEQQALKGQYTQTYGSGANAFSADQGYSEHQLGTTADLTIASVGGTYGSFANTEAYRWLLQNAYKHGFILSYPQGNAHYIFEPWHWRFVGEDLARDLNRSKKTFYDLEQREIDEYLISIFD